MATKLQIASPEASGAYAPAREAAASRLQRKAAAKVGRRPKTEKAAKSRVEREAAVSDVADIAGFLQEHLGQRITAYLSGLKDPKVVGQWTRHKARPRELPTQRLRCAFQAAQLLVSAYGDETARAWFFGSNHRLNDEAPAYVLRHAKEPADLHGVVTSAHAFASEVGF